MDTSSNSDFIELNRRGRQRIVTYRQEIKASRIHSWEWSADGFYPAMRWLLTHPHDVRHGRFLSDTSGREVWRLTTPARYGGQDIVMKTYITPKGFQETFAPSEAVIEATNYAVLNELGISTAKVLACGENRSLGCVRSSFIVTEFIGNTYDGTTLMPGGALWESNDIRMKFSEEAFNVLARIHACKLFHKSFHPHKMLITKTEHVKDLAISLIDVTAAKFQNTGILTGIAEDILTFVVDMRLTAEEIQQLCKYYLLKNPTCHLSPQALWERLLKQESKHL